MRNDDVDGTRGIVFGLRRVPRQCADNKINAHRANVAFVPPTVFT